MKLSVVVPALNEEATIETVLDRLAQLPVDHEIIVAGFCFNAKTVLGR